MIEGCFDHSLDATEAVSCARIAGLSSRYHLSLLPCQVACLQRPCCRASTPGRDHRGAAYPSLCPDPGRHGHDHGLGRGLAPCPCRGTDQRAHLRGRVRLRDHGPFLGRVCRFFRVILIVICVCGFCRLFFYRPSCRLSGRYVYRSLVFCRSRDRAVLHALRVAPCWAVWLSELELMGWIISLRRAQ